MKDLRLTFYDLRGRLLLLAAAAFFVAAFCGCQRGPDARDVRIAKMETRLSCLESNCAALCDELTNLCGIVLAYNITNQQELADLKLLVLDGQAKATEAADLIEVLMARMTNRPAAATPSARYMATVGKPRTAAAPFIVWGRVVQRLGTNLLVNAESQFENGVSEVMLKSTELFLHNHAKELGLSYEWQQGVPKKWELARHTVLLAGYPKVSTVADGDVVLAQAWFDRFYEFTTVRGSVSTVRLYTCIPK